MMKVAGGAILVICLMLTGCDIDGFDQMSRVKEDFHYSYKLTPGGRLELENFNGSVEITGWDKDTVEIDGTKHAPTRELLDAMKIDVSASPGVIRVRSVRPPERRGNMGVKYVLRVPRKVLLDRIVSSNGSIRVQSVEGSVRVKTSNGSVRASNLKGDIDVTTSNGAVELADFTGGAVLHTSNGSIRAQGVRGHFEAITSNGGIDVHVAEASGWPIRAESSNGKIALTIDSLSNTGVRASTSNASITLRLPSSARAQVKASTSNSSASSDFDIAARGTHSKNRLEGTIGSGGPLLDLSTSNGSIRIQKM
ncbi:MAG TPA: DUF4097 family beta strand repeat-containing protein [Bryobacteraceae bacterium]|nr:DUF4097 family beta strand repeat-containing protein [Bryobacteraceae bacterium]